MPTEQRSLEQVVRDMLESFGDSGAQGRTSGDLVGPANVLADYLQEIGRLPKVARISYHPNGLPNEVQFQTWLDERER